LDLPGLFIEIGPTSAGGRQALPQNFAQPVLIYSAAGATSACHQSGQLAGYESDRQRYRSWTTATVEPAEPARSQLGSR